MVPAIAADGGDPRMPDTVITDELGPNSPVSRLLHNPSVTFEEYRYYAEKTRAEESEAAKTEPPSRGILQVIFPTKSDAGVTPIFDSPQSSDSPPDGDEKKAAPEFASQRSRRIKVTDAEWTNASRAIRTASGAACFYLITTDILGPFGIGYVDTHSVMCNRSWWQILDGYSRLGTWNCLVHRFRYHGRLVSDIVSITHLFVMLTLNSSGYLLWTCFLGLDSYE